jgi:Zn-dependent protease with chaperone function
LDEPNQLSLPYSRLHEEEADLIGLDTLVQACVNPSAAVRVWEAMARKDNELGADETHGGSSTSTSTSTSTSSSTSTSTSTSTSGAGSNGEGDGTNANRSEDWRSGEWQWEQAKGYFKRLLTLLHTLSSTHPRSIDRLEVIQDALPLKMKAFAASHTRCQGMRKQLEQAGVGGRKLPPGWG